MNFSFHQEAEKELNEAIDYYEDIEPGLGYDFALEVRSAIDRLVDFPKAWAVLDSDVRRSLVKQSNGSGSVFLRPNLILQFA
ncbi:type II toxin-antitoxin system RelE/ParE family toxin [Thiorhodovibrio winogradskyi]|uniref:type II toxin-antitoxin system RelE/ParE family toxin n=1 Tax=Thiorhodovibrio winogradskyi TaxID=77007 RepID=UPI002E286979|nr:type II toxin-antitoxin system RelE/ParE family toxin [Thiorhodovibrio winogradskyi]